MLFKKISLLLCCVFLVCSLFAQTRYFQQQVDYKMNVTLNDKEHSLDAYSSITYKNNSPDTLRFIWFHLWPNAYKNDQTAFSDQLLQNGRTDFYFSNNDKRGYINRLDFRIEGTTVKVEDHPHYIDVVKLILPASLAPGGTVVITTPFHVQLPYNFSRGGHFGQSYQVTQWYPKPAVYDRRGWHPIPYLDQGEFYSEFGNFEVTITLPRNYVVAATGELQNDEEKQWLNSRASYKGATQKKTVGKKKPQITVLVPLSSDEKKTLVYKQQNVHDFAWFADKSYVVSHDTMQLPSGRTIDVYAYYTGKGKAVWKNATGYIKQTVATRSSWLGEYPYNVVSAVEAQMGFSGGMEYPTITSISPVSSPRALELVIEHEVGHNWNYGILGTNERQHPWMDEGMNTYFDMKYIKEKHPGEALVGINTKSSFLNKRLPSDPEKLVYETVTKGKTDQPIETSSEDFSLINYNIIAYYKTGLWMRYIEQLVGSPAFSTAMNTYYDQWKFKHPYPEDFKNVLEKSTGRNLDSAFSLLRKTGALVPPQKRTFKVTSYFSFKDTDKYKYLFVGPAAGYNKYDGIMLGGFFHNYTLPQEWFQFFAAPLYATKSKVLNGIGETHYTSYFNRGSFSKFQVGISAEKFSTNVSLDSNGGNLFENFQKFVPSLKLTFRHSARNTSLKTISFKSYLITENKIDYATAVVKSTDQLYYPIRTIQQFRYVNQLTFAESNDRVLYPYDYEVQLQQGDGFYRLNLTGNYFFNYSKGGGASVRVFAAKFGLFNNSNNPDAYIYEPRLWAATGQLDYTYSNYFIGRSASDAYGDDALVENKGLAARQIKIQDGGFKVRYDQFDRLSGRSEDWVAAMNFKTTLPSAILPSFLPLRVFFDIGTYSEAWQPNPQTSRFLYVGGLQLSLFKDILNVYYPVIFYKELNDDLKTLPGANSFSKRLTFSIDIQNINLRRIIKTNFL